MSLIAPQKRPAHTLRAGTPECFPLDAGTAGKTGATIVFGATGESGSTLPDRLERRNLECKPNSPRSESACDIAPNFHRPLILRPVPFWSHPATCTYLCKAVEILGQPLATQRIPTHQALG